VEVVGSILEYVHEIDQEVRTVLDVRVVNVFTYRSNPHLFEERFKLS
jgi:hypothetical protein